MTSTDLPPGRHFALTWGIAAPYGGMTTALLQRSRLFAEAGTPVDVLTLDDRPAELGPEFADLARAGVRVRNLYDWARAGVVASRGPVPDAPAPLPGDASDIVTDVVAGVAVRRVRLGDDGKPRDLDHLRADGSTALSERRVGKRGRVMIAYDAAGAPVRSWRRRYDLYGDWLDHLVGDDEAFVIVDSKTVAPFAADYHRRRVTTVHVVHGSHRGPTPGSVRASRTPVFSRLADFDAVAFATDAQRRDVRALVGRRPALVTVAHPVTMPPAERLPAEPERSGAVVLARLEPIKRVEDAVAAVMSRNARATAPIGLDVYGSGSRRDDLEQQAAGDDAVRLHGHTDEAARALAGASILLLTSRSEAFGLALLEAMAVGCLPIAYDIAYGPGDLIRHGENGWLVPDGDVAALAAAIEVAERLPPSARAAMRDRARATAAAYGGDRIRLRWATVLRAARRRHRRTGALRPLAVRVRQAGDAVRSRGRRLLRRAGVRR
ncbi:MAG: glycosyltransferase [Microbacterium arborescens]